MRPTPADAGTPASEEEASVDASVPEPGLDAAADADAGPSPLPSDCQVVEELEPCSEPGCFTHACTHIAECSPDGGLERTVVVICYELDETDPEAGRACQCYRNQESSMLPKIYRGQGSACSPALIDCANQE
jgi:hypothetical protein